jgi:uncharacterized membrane protein YkvI
MGFLHGIIRVGFGVLVVHVIFIAMGIILWELRFNSTTTYHNLQFKNVFSDKWKKKKVIILILYMHNFYMYLEWDLYLQKDLN